VPDRVQVKLVQLEKFWLLRRAMGGEAGKFIIREQALIAIITIR
jgi:hypothetical protein